MVLGRRPLGAVLHSSNEPGELSQWLCHDDSTINIVLDIIIIIIIIYPELELVATQFAIDAANQHKILVYFFLRLISANNVH